jgi:endonuclease/exonuclease/phosphatase family metal-dependent hydrolase
VELTIATFNIRTGWGFDLLNSWPFRRPATARAISDLGASAVGLQEVLEFQRQYIDDQISDCRWLGGGREGGRRGEQCPVLVTSPDIEIVSSVTRWYGPNTDDPTRLPGASAPRIATLARLRDSMSDVTFDVANTHLDERISDNRALSIQQLVTWLAPDTPTIVTGDFNAGPDDQIFAPLLDLGLSMVPVTGGTTHQFTGRTDGRRIDHIFVSRHWTIAEAEVVHERPGGRLPSDHWPVRARLLL